ncbi:cytokine receptor common subunit beta isoform X1 [Silurus meridionalis]|uniref:cytokine receptor common subunit beta isoform X1 n=1 Tax=Silurus meridionalis TaxID=175797 RepID=UPI001EEB6638|nr:cytokine receptor common subunit beta isoform X1 [Silurus meridionalis]XP_046722861.1 cytokine receptor common subunit beta isoform X1 [Silurus meridionalis]XP_046722862.1 cytokine receptor common subunit beta isoform X1 [Silurus meridionalis]XP_046722863.1 cytokine receptor common subunit beta isoform X1 [Silurus meridionalis]
MFSLRTLLIAALPLLVLSSEPEQCSFQEFTRHSKYSPVLASLQCYNDFTTQIRCTWEEPADAHLHIAVRTKGQCVSDSNRELQSNGMFSRSCVYETQVFSMGNHEFFINTSCPSKVTTFNIATQGKVLPPANFSVKKQNSGHQVLSWSSPYPPSSPLTLNLTYQLKYRRHDHEWIVVDDINVTEFVIESQTILLGYSYEARVRARSPVGPWGSWSQKVVWMIEKEGIVNLQCVLKEGGVMCDWLVQSSQAKFLSYYLCGHISGRDMKCIHCDSQVEPSQFENFVHLKCYMDSPEPELLTMEIRSLRKFKAICNPDNIQPPRPLQLKVYMKDDVLKLSWARPSVSEKLTLSYLVYLESIDKEEKVNMNCSEPDLSINIPFNLRPSTRYIAMMRAVPGPAFAGRPSDWSDPVYFTTPLAPGTKTPIYILIAVLVAVLFIILYNALPACHRRFVLWNISIPSPINSKALGEISNKKLLDNPYTDNEKTSVFIIQTSDNPIICKGSISEYPLLTCSSDIDLAMTDSGWPQGSSHSSLFVEGQTICRMTDKSGISFIGPYILCRKDSSSTTETSDTFFSSHLNFGDDERYVSESTEDSMSIKGGYVLTPPKNSASECSTKIDNLSSENRESKKSELPNDDPPAYTPSPDAASSAIFSHPSGYCLMPNMETVAGWVSASIPLPEGNTERKLHQIEGDSPERSYVTLSQRGL